MSPHADDIPEEHHALVERLRAGDVDALDALLQSYWRGVVLFATRALGDDEAAQDVAQETFIRIWRARADLTGDRFRAYLYRVARNLVTDEVRRRDVRSRWVEHSTTETAYELLPDQVLITRELNLAIAHAIEALTPRRREAFVLAYLHGLSYKEVADAMGVSTSTVKNQISAALADLRTALSPSDPNRPA